MGRHLIVIEENSKRGLDFPGKESLFYGTFDSPFGACTIAGTSDVLCYLGFSKPKALAYVSKKWPNAVLECAPKKLEPLFKAAVQLWKGKAVKPLKIILPGTEFQRRVWEALTKIPRGEVVSYEALAREAGNPKAVRAAGTAVGSNPLSLVIPCHRIIRKDGSLGGFGWGLKMKQKILNLENNGKSS